jgi:hypothetical protein
MVKRIIASVLMIVLGLGLLSFSVYRMFYSDAFDRGAKHLLRKGEGAASVVFQRLDKFKFVDKERLENNRALALLLKAQNSDALKSFLRLAGITKDRHIKATALYNAALASVLSANEYDDSDLAREYKSKKMAELMRLALKLFHDCLQLEPDNWQAKWNYEALFTTMTKNNMSMEGEGEQGGDGTNIGKQQAGKGIPKPKL